MDTDTDNEEVTHVGYRPSCRSPHKKKYVPQPDEQPPVELRAYRYANGLDLWTGKPLSGKRKIS